MTEPTVAGPLTSSGARVFTLSSATVMAVVFAVALGSSRSLTQPAAFLVAGAGVVIGSAWYATRPRLAPRPSEVSPAAVGVWLAISGAFCGWEAAAFAMGDDDAHPTFSKLTDPLLAHPGLRALAGLGWVVWGRHLASLDAWDDRPETSR